MQDTGETQSGVSAAYGVQQASLSRFLSGGSGLSGDAILRLWPFVYGNAGPCPTKSLSAESGEGGDDAE